MAERQAKGLRLNASGAYAVLGYFSFIWADLDARWIIVSTIRKDEPGMMQLWERRNAKDTNMPNSTATNHIAAIKSSSESEVRTRKIWDPIRYRQKKPQNDARCEKSALRTPSHERRTDASIQRDATLLHKTQREWKHSLSWQDRTLISCSSGKKRVEMRAHRAWRRYTRIRGTNEIVISEVPPSSMALGAIGHMKSGLFRERSCSWKRFHEVSYKQGRHHEYTLGKSNICRLVPSRIDDFLTSDCSFSTILHSCWWTRSQNRH